MIKRTHICIKRNKKEDLRLKEGERNLFVSKNTIKNLYKRDLMAEKNHEKK